MRCYPAVLVIAAIALAPGCKGKTKYRENPETIDRLTSCRNLAAEKQKYIATLEGQVAVLREKGSEDGEIVITVLDDSLVIKGPSGPHGKARPKDPVATAKDEQLYAAFLKKVNGSRGKMRKCYQNALKKDSSLQARTITLNITVKYKASGGVANANFDKRLTSAFGSCMGAVARSWKLPRTPRGVTFKTPVTLEPR